MNVTMKYPKIQSIFKRDDKGNFTAEYSSDEIAYLSKNTWIGTEKIHGTNIRLSFSQTGKRGVQGRGNNSEIPHFLASKLWNIITDIPFEDYLTESADGYPNVTIYGEGYGPGIQNVGSHYADEPSFIAFDVNINGYWLNDASLKEFTTDLNIPLVPTIFRGDLNLAIQNAQQGFDSKIAKYKMTAEGYVLKPAVPMYDNRGNRIITKVKYEDFKWLRKEFLNPLS